MKRPEVDPNQNPRESLNPTDPDAIMQSDLPQVPEEQIDDYPTVVIGRIEGRLRHVAAAHISKGIGGETVRLNKPVTTQFVLVSLPDGTCRVERYQQQKHGVWEDIPDTGLTPSGIFQQLLGGETQVPNVQQLQNERKKRGGASRKRWQPTHSTRAPDRPSGDPTYRISKSLPSQIRKNRTNTGSK